VFRRAIGAWLCGYIRLFADEGSLFSLYDPDKWDDHFFEGDTAVRNSALPIQHQCAASRREQGQQVLGKPERFPTECIREVEATLLRRMSFE
jgi:hypothetical protein